MNDKTFTLIGAHGKEDRQREDYYATDPQALKPLLENVYFEDVWECACGGGHLSNVLESLGKLKRKSDIYDRGCQAEIFDFLNDFLNTNWSGDIITNPPYANALEFVKKSLQIIAPQRKAAFLLRIQFLEGSERRRFFEKNPPKYVFVFSNRVTCAKNGDFEKYSGSAMCYAWFVWEKGFKGDPVIKWI